MGEEWEQTEYHLEGLWLLCMGTDEAGASPHDCFTGLSMTIPQQKPRWGLHDAVRTALGRRNLFLLRE